LERWITAIQNGDPSDWIQRIQIYLARGKVVKLGAGYRVEFVGVQYAAEGISGYFSTDMNKRTGS
jgi:hypothetical protein